MNLIRAIETIKAAGRVRVDGADLIVRFPREHGPEIEAALNTLREHKWEAIRLLVEVPSAEEWPESLRELAEEISADSNDPETARREVWLSWYEWKAQRLNELFRSQGKTGEPGRINAATIRHGERKR